MTLYLTGVKGPAVLPLLDSGEVGLLDTPANSYVKRPGWLWAADNGCFNERTYVGDEAWFSWLERNAAQADTCLFATAPDVVGDHGATVARSLPWLPRIRALGYPAAFVAQNGATAANVPWDSFDVLFIGGDTAWKLGPAAADLALVARRRGKRAHMGRVNSYKRLRHAAAIGCDTVDGTYLAFGPNVNVPRLRSWIDRMNGAPFLPLARAAVQRRTYRQSAARTTAVTVVPSASAFSRAASHTSSGMRTLRSGVFAISDQALRDQGSLAVGDGLGDGGDPGGRRGGRADLLDGENAMQRHAPVGLAAISVDKEQQVRWVATDGRAVLGDAVRAVDGNVNGEGVGVHDFLLRLAAPAACRYTVRRVGTRRQAFAAAFFRAPTNLIGATA